MYEVYEIKCHHPEDTRNKSELGKNDIRKQKTNCKYKQTPYSITSDLEMAKDVKSWPTNPESFDVEERVVVNGGYKEQTNTQEHRQDKNWHKRHKINSNAIDFIIDLTDWVLFMPALVSLEDIPE